MITTPNEQRKSNELTLGTRLHTAHHDVMLLDAKYAHNTVDSLFYEAAIVTKIVMLHNRYVRRP